MCYLLRLPKSTSWMIQLFSDKIFNSRVNFRLAIKIGILMKLTSTLSTAFVEDVNGNLSQTICGDV